MKSHVTTYMADSQIFVDRSVVEVFANRTRPDGKEFGKVILMEVA